MEDSRSGQVVPIWPKDLADIVRQDPNWKGQPITLGACNTGEKWPNGHGGRKKWNEFAQDLANELGVDVTAPMGFTWYVPGKGMLGSSGPSAPPDAGSIGRWSTFSPQR